MAKISRTEQARRNARIIVGQLEVLATKSQQAYDEAVIVHDNAVNLARLVCDGYISQVSESGATLLAYTVKVLMTALEHGVKLMQAPMVAGETVIESDGYAVVVERKNLSGTSAFVSDDTARGGSWVSLLWAPRSTVIVG